MPPAMEKMRGEKEPCSLYSVLVFRSLSGLQSMVTRLEGLVAVGSCGWVKNLNIKISMLLAFFYKASKKISSEIKWM